MEKKRKKKTEQQESEQKLGVISGTQEGMQVLLHMSNDERHK